MNFLKNVVFNKDFRKVYKEGEKIEFRPGVNLLVGDQGCGKSSLLFSIKQKDIVTMECDLCTYMAFDFEKDNLRIKEEMHKLTTVHVMMLFSSHGQSNNAILNELERKEKTLFLIDEPDMALSVRSCNKLVNKMKKAVDNGCQVVAAVHNPVVILGFPSVFSVEHKQWMNSKDFVESHNE